MTAKGRIKKVFSGSNTSVGFYSLFDNITGREARRMFIIKGGPGTGKSTFMRAIGEELRDRGYTIEQHYCSSDPGSLDALVIPALKVALLDGTAPHMIDPVIPGAAEEIVNLGEYWVEDVLESHKDEIIRIKKRMRRHFDTAYSLLRESKVAYDEWSSYIAEAIDRTRYNKITRILVESIFADKAREARLEPDARHMFASAITSRGIVDHLETLLDDIMNLYSVKGEPGSGVKELIARIAQEASERGFFTEQYHCPYEPYKLDMVIIPAIGTAVINSSLPYHLDIKKLDRVRIIEEIDLYSCFRQQDIREYDEELQDAKLRYNSLVAKAIQSLAKAMDVHARLEHIYAEAMDFERVNQKRAEVLAKILKLSLS